MQLVPVRLYLVGEIVEHEEGQLLFTCRIVNVTSVQSRLSGLCTLLIEVAANINSIWNMLCGVVELEIRLTGLHRLRFLALVKHHVHVW